MAEAKKVTKLQQNIVKSISTIVDSKLNKQVSPQNKVGTVVQDPVGYKCIVNIYGTEYSCILPEHLHDWISKDDIVIVQDLYGNGSNLTIIGSTGSTRSQSLIIHDEEKSRNISGVTKFEDESGKQNDYYLTVDK